MTEAKGSPLVRLAVIIACIAGAAMAVSFAYYFIVALPQQQVSQVPENGGTLLSGCQNDCTNKYNTCIGNVRAFKEECKIQKDRCESDCDGKQSSCVRACYADKHIDECLAKSQDSALCQVEIDECDYQCTYISWD